MANNSPAYFSDPFAVKAGKRYRWALPATASAASGTVQVTLQPLDITGAAVGSPLSLWNATPVVGDQTFSGNSPVLPATAVQGVLQVAYVDTAGSGHTLTCSALTTWEEIASLPEAAYQWVDGAGVVRAELDLQPGVTPLVLFQAPLAGDVLKFATVDSNITFVPGTGGVTRAVGTLAAVGPGIINAETKFQLNGVDGATGTSGGGDTVAGGIITVLGSGPPPVADLEASYDALSLSLSAGANVDPWTDDTGNGWDLTTPATCTAPTYDALGLAYRPDVYFNTSGQLRNASFNALAGKAGCTLFGLVGAIAYSGSDQIICAFGGYIDCYLAINASQLYFWVGGAAAYLIAGNAGDLTRTTPSLVTAWYDGTQTGNGRLRLYLNGVAAGVNYALTYNGTAPTTLPSSTVLNVGGFNANTQLWGSQIAAVRVYSRALTGAEIAQVTREMLADRPIV